MFVFFVLFSFFYVRVTAIWNYLPEENKYFDGLKLQPKTNFEDKSAVLSQDIERGVVRRVHGPNET